MIPLIRNHDFKQKKASLTLNFKMKENKLSPVHKRLTGKLKYSAVNILHVSGNHSRHINKF